MKKLLLSFVAVSLLCACSPTSFYQLYKVSTNGLEQRDGLLAFENEHCTISYDLWGEHGDLSFMMFNKTDQNIYVVMPKSFFIQNGMAYDYYTNALHVSRQVSKVGGTTAYASVIGNGILSTGKSASYAQSVIAEKSTTTKEMEVVCIPPKAAKRFIGFSLVKNAHKDCDDYDFNYPKKASDIITYDKEYSPWVFRNRIAYTLDGGDGDCEYIENELWVSYLQNYSLTAMQERVKGVACETKYPTTTTIILNQAPNAFYNIYTKTIGATKQRTPIKNEKDEVYLY